MGTNFTRYQIATAIAILFHAIGLVGIVWLKNEWIINQASFTLLLMFALLIWTQERKNLAFWIFVGFTVLAGLGVEMIGVHTKTIFGDYSYGNVLGHKIYDVPVIIGVNWFIIIFCCGIFINTLLRKIVDKIATDTEVSSVKIKAISTIVDGATVAVFFDWLIEPVAIKLGYWKWAGGDIPFFNYASWFMVAMVMLAVFQRLNIFKQNKFAVHLLMIQAMFFLLLRLKIVNT